MGTTWKTPEQVAQELEQRAREIRKAEKFFARILRRYSEGHEPSVKRDGKAWDEAVKVYQRESLLEPNSGHLCWRD